MMDKLPPLRAIFDALPNPILVVDDDNMICLANSAAEDFFQASSTVLARNRLEDAMPFFKPCSRSRATGSPTLRRHE